MAEDPGAAEEERFMRLASEAAGSLVSGLVSFGLLDAPEDEPARVQAREKARHLFLFVIISVLLEERRAAAERLKEAFALELLETRRQIRSMAKSALDRRDAARYGKELERAASRDPFAPYFESFEKMRKNPQEGPFAILARRLSEEHFEGEKRRRAYLRVFDLAAELSSQLIGRIGH